MALFLSMLPVYLLGNLHCMGMCGPLVMLLGKHRYRMFYFLGRTLTFSLAGMVAGALGSVVNQSLTAMHLPMLTCFAFGGFILVYGLGQLLGWRIPMPHFLGRISQRLSLLLLKDRPETTFLFGASTILLPCGQTLIVFAACALAGGLFTGFFNGLAFALLTSPALFLAMQARRFLSSAKRLYRPVMGGLALFVGTLALCRGLAEANVIPHLILVPRYHIALF